MLQHITSRSDLLNKGGKGSVETVKSNAQIRKDLKELVEMKSELVRVHEEEEKKALKKAKTVSRRDRRAGHHLPLPSPHPRPLRACRACSSRPTPPSCMLAATAAAAGCPAATTALPPAHPVRSVFGHQLPDVSTPLQKPGKEETVQKNLAKRKEIIDVIQENIDDLKYQV